MNLALGEFLTEMGRVEFSMLLLVSLIRDEDIEWLFDQYSVKTFGPKIEWFKAWTSDPEAFSPENKLILDQMYKDLAELLPKRNSLVHGETYEEEFKGRPKQPYRVGVIKKNIAYLDQFSRAQFGDNVFDIQQVKAATKLCVRIWKGINKIRGVTVPMWEQQWAERA
jgi:hypothetical protein